MHLPVCSLGMLHASLCSPFGYRIANEGNKIPWPIEEQKVPEQALKTIPSQYPCKMGKNSSSIAQQIKEGLHETIRELVEMVKAKMGAQEQVLNASRAEKCLHDNPR